ncbi:DUF4276 family protein [Actinosynnema sp. NPDC053489]|uniref:DUF4276 family protein n=1 Tax=Actinosynnema sp. NPDC053489 TaxID=3363916 RepID=UPI0037C56BC1
MTGAFRRVHLLVEGQTEEVVADSVIRPHLEGLGWVTSVSLVKTKRPAAGPSHKGGITGWAQVQRDVRLLLNDTSLDVLTTVFDYYAFPADCPGMADRPFGDVYERVEHVEHRLAEAVGDPRFRPNLVIHELEAWVFAAAEELGQLLGGELAARLRDDVHRAGGPELINDGPATAPSKRLLAYHPGYVKTIDGPLAVQDLGLARLRAACPHLDRWLGAFEG